ncbi:MAG: Mannuronate-specific alginate lyase [Bacteroidota bacterium]
MRKIFLYLSISITFLVACSKEDAIPSYQLFVDVTPVSGGSVSPNAGSYMKGESVQLIAKPAAEYLFKEWRGAYSGSSNPGALLMDADKRITGVFEKRQYPLNLTIEGNGTVKEEIVAVASQAQYPSGTTVKLTAIPAAGAMFSEWKGDITSKDSVITTLVNKAISLQAIFQAKGPDYSTKYSGARAANMSKALVNVNVHPESIKVIQVKGKYYLITAHAELFETTYDSYRSFEIDSLTGQMTENTNAFLGGYYNVGFPKSPFFYEDLNGDGIKDLFEVDHGKESASLIVDGKFPGFNNHLFLGTADGKFTYSTVAGLTDSKRFHHNASVGDLDNDGDHDLLLQYFGMDEIIYFKNSNGLKLSMPVNPNNATGAVLITDIDADGKNDIISAPYIDKSSVPFTYVLKMNVNGETFTSSKISNVTPFGNGYGCFKLFALKNPNNPSKKNIIYLVEGGIGDQKIFRSDENDQAKIQEISTVQSTFQTNGIRDYILADLNFDGLEDVFFITNSGENLNQRVWLNKGNNTFENAQWEINAKFGGHFLPLSYDSKSKRIKFLYYENFASPKTQIVDIYTGKR